MDPGYEVSTWEYIELPQVVFLSQKAQSQVESQFKSSQIESLFSLCPSGFLKDLSYIDSN